MGNYDAVAVDNRLTAMRTFSGKWADEFRTNDIKRFRGSYVEQLRMIFYFPTDVTALDKTAVAF